MRSLSNGFECIPEFIVPISIELRLQTFSGSFPSFISNECTDCFQLLKCWPEMKNDYLSAKVDRRNPQHQILIRIQNDFFFFSVNHDFHYFQNFTVGCSGKSTGLGQESWTLQFCPAAVTLLPCNQTNNLLPWISY